MREPAPNVPASGDQPRGTPIHISDLGISMGVLSIILVPAPGYCEPSAHLHPLDVPGQDVGDGS